ncbi:hypothetical protein GGR51DRAFT_561932 [Nemania sp. FL0031]|nr:hypothetical protein GGR51DRAFT_561932 [Nemania sp. FL0031]
MTASRRRESQGELKRSSSSSSSGSDESLTAPVSPAVSRPVAAHQPHEIESGQRPRDTIRSSVSSRDTPDTYYGGDTSEADENARGNSDAASYPHSPPPPEGDDSGLGGRLTQGGGLPGSFNQQLPHSQSGHQPSGVTVRVRGVDFEMLSSTVVAPPPVRHPAPTPPPPTERGRGLEKAPVSRPPSRSPSPGYGAWQPDFDQPRNRRRSVLKRAQARVERSIHEHLVKAGRRSPPSFKVHSVTKSSHSGVENKTVPAPAEEQIGESDHNPDLGHTSLPLTTADPWATHTQSIMEPQALTHTEDEGDQSGKSVGLKSDNDGSDADSKSLPESPPLFFESRHGDRDENEAGESDTEQTSEDSLFFTPKGSSMRDSTASNSFFSSDYARRQLAAIRNIEELEKGEGQQDSETQPQRQSSMRHEECEAPRDCLEGLTREQLEFASLPSAIEDLRAPFPFDDRLLAMGLTTLAIVRPRPNQYNITLSGNGDLESGSRSLKSEKSQEYITIERLDTLVGKNLGGGVHNGNQGNIRYQSNGPIIVILPKTYTA